MKMTTEEFIASFHSISGTTIGERRKNLFLLLNRIEPTQSNELDFSRLQPKTPLEEKFKVEVLIYFRRSSDLMEVLKTENPILIERILKVFWLVEKAFGNITGRQLVTEVFPYISFNAKAKILNKLSLHLKSCQLADDYFQAIEEKYGLYLASKLLPACSSGVIMKCIEFQRVTLTPRQLLTIIKKYPEITESILEILDNKMNSLHEYINIFLYLAQHDIRLFLKLSKEYNISFHLGWRLTDKFIQSHYRQDVIKNPDKYSKLLHNKQIAKSLNQDFKYLYINLFPKSLSRLNSSYDKILSIMKKLPRRMQGVKLLLTTFEKIYGIQMWHSRYMNKTVLDMLPVNERLGRMYPEKKPPHKSEDELVCDMETEKSIPQLKKTISLTSDIDTRVELVRLLVKTCKINEDEVALLNVCKYMITRHRNDHISVRKAFLKALQNSFDLHNLEEQHWTSINELIDIFVLNDEHFSETRSFLEVNIHSRLKRDLPIKEQLIKWLNSYHDLHIIREEPRYQKQCLLMFGEIIPEIFKEEKGEENEEQDENDLDLRNISFVSALISWNKLYPKDKVSLFSYPDAMESVKRSLINGNSSDVMNVINYCLHLKTDAEERTKLLCLYFNSPGAYLDKEMIKWLLQHEPLTIIHNIEAIVRLSLKMSSFHRNYHFFWKYWRNYTHLESFPKVINICLSTIETNKDYSSVKDFKNVIVGLSYMLVGDEFKKVIAPYYPSSLQADATSEESRNLYSIQQTIVTCLKNLNPPSLALESILIFCKGDYLKLIQGSLYSVCGNVNEDKLPLFFSEISGRAVSVRKHAIHLAFRVVNKEQIYNVLQTFMKAEKNASVRKFLFKGIFNLFTMNPDDYSWGMVKENANALDIDDKEALEILMEFHRIPDQYTVEYIIFAFGILNNLHDPKREMDHDKAILLRQITTNTIELFPKEFYNTIINKYFLKSDGASLTQLQSDVHVFTCRYIIYCGTPVEQEEHLKLCFEVIKKFVSTTWQDAKIKKKARSCVQNFLKSFCLEYLKEKSLNTEILYKFAHLWNNFFEPHQAFEEYLYLQFTLIHVEKLPLHQIGQKLGKLCNSLASAYGSAIIKNFFNEINSFRDYFVKYQGEKVLESNWFILTENIIQPESSVHCWVLVMFILNDHKPTISETKIKYRRIIDMLINSPDPVIQLYLETRFKSFVTASTINK